MTAETICPSCAERMAATGNARATGAVPWKARSTSSPVIRMEGLGKRYPMGEGEVRALENVDFAVQEGEFVAIVGPSGSGKSTLMNIIGLLDVPDDGTYWLNGLDVRLPLSYRGTRPREANAFARRYLAKVGLEGRERHLPHQLSGGQQQRVAIARALVGNPSILLADEPTGALDSRTSIEIMGLFEDLHREGQTVVLITHNPSLAARAERTASIADGRLQEGKGSGSKTAADEAARRITLQARGFAGEGGRRATDAIS